MGRSITEIVAEAKACVPAIGHNEAAQLLGRGDVLFVDVRDAGEVAQSGKIKGALNVSRGMLEFRADAAMPTHNKAFSKDKTIILYCGTGGRAALCGKALQELGFGDVRSLGAFKDWVEAGGAVDSP